MNKKISCHLIPLSVYVKFSYVPCQNDFCPAPKCDCISAEGSQKVKENHEHFPVCVIFYNLKHQLILSLTC